jgi:hypothetical protein
MKVVLVRAMEVCGRLEVVPHAFLTAAVDECTRSAACSGHFTHRDKIIATQDWQDQRADLDSLEKLTLPVNTDKNKFSH